MRLLPLTAVVLAGAIDAFAQDTWAYKAEAPGPVCYQGGGEVSGKFYMAGGMEPLSTAFYADTYMYDPATDAWTPKASLPFPLLVMGSASHGGKVYFFGGTTDGFAPLTTVLAYDPATDAWTPKTSMPTARNAPICLATSTHIYVCGGMDGFMIPMKTVEAYEVSSGTWSTKPDLPEALTWAFGGVIGGKVYVAGGKDSTGSASTRTYEFDPATSTWSTKAPLSITISSGFTGGAYAGASGVIDGRLLITGGIVGGSTGWVGLLEYDPATDAWATRAAPPLWHNYNWGTAASGKFYSIGNYYGGFGTPPDKSNLQYSPLTLTVDVSVDSITAPATATLGSTVDLAAGVSNAGDATVSFDVVFRVDGVEVGRASVSGLAPGTSSAVSVPWPTAGQALGRHTVTALIAQLPGETSVANNQATAFLDLTDGTSSPGSASKKKKSCSASAVGDGGPLWMALVLSALAALARRYR